MKKSIAAALLVSACASTNPAHYHAQCGVATQTPAVVTDRVTGAEMQTKPEPITAEQSACVANSVAVAAMQNNQTRADVAMALIAGMAGAAIGASMYRPSYSYRPSFRRH